MTGRRKSWWSSPASRVQNLACIFSIAASSRRFPPSSLGTFQRAKTCWEWEGIPVSRVQHQKTERDQLKDGADLRPGQEDFDKPLSPSYWGRVSLEGLFQGVVPLSPVLNQESCEWLNPRLTDAKQKGQLQDHCSESVCQRLEESHGPYTAGLMAGIQLEQQGCYPPPVLPWL